MTRPSGPFVTQFATKNPGQVEPHEWAHGLDSKHVCLEPEHRLT